MNYRIKDYFQGSQSQLVKLGKDATMLYRLQYKENPPQIEDAEYGSVNTYPEEILATLTKPVAQPVINFKCSPIAAKGLNHSWECRYKKYNEFESIFKNTIGGTLIKNITYEKVSFGYQFKFSLLSGKFTLNVQMNNNYISRNILASMISYKIEMGDNIQMMIKPSETSEYANTIIKINDKIIRGKKLEIDEILEWIDNGGAL